MYQVNGLLQTRCDLYGLQQNSGAFLGKHLTLRTKTLFIFLFGLSGEVRLRQDETNPVIRIFRQDDMILVG